MKRTALIATLIALVALVAFTIPTFAQGPMGGNGRGFGFEPTQGITPTVPFNGYGMMGGSGMMNGYGFGPNQAITPTFPFGNNGAYGMMGGGMTLAPHVAVAKFSHSHAGVGGFGFNQPSGKMTVTVDQARANAEQYVKANLPNATVEKEGDTFYGYYNFDVVQNGNTYGTLSVNGYTGAVWYHTWHGNFITKKSVD